MKIFSKIYTYPTTKAQSNADTLVGVALINLRHRRPMTTDMEIPKTNKFRISMEPHATAFVLSPNGRKVARKNKR